MSAQRSLNIQEIEQVFFLMYCDGVGYRVCRNDI